MLSRSFGGINFIRQPHVANVKMLVGLWCWAHLSLGSMFFFKCRYSTLCILTKVVINMVCTMLCNIDSKIKKILKMDFESLKAVFGEIFGRNGQNPSVSQTNWLWQTLSLSPPMNYGGVSYPGRGSPLGNHFPPPGKILNLTENRYLPYPTSKKILPLPSWRPLDYKSHIVSALHLQGLNSNIYMHFHLVNKPLIGISFRKWKHQWRT